MDGHGRVRVAAASSEGKSSANAGAAGLADGAKRGRTEAEFVDAEEGADVVKRSELDDLLNQFKGDLTETMEASIDKSVSELKDSLRASVFEDTAALIRKLDESYQKRFQQTEGDIKHLHELHKESQSQIELLKKEIKQIQSGLSVAQKTTVTRKELFGDDFDAEPDLSILRVSVHGRGKATAAAIEVAVKELVENAACPAEFKVQGGKIGHNFSVHFQGANGLGARHVKKCINYLRDNEWPATYAKATDGHSARVYFDFNKSGKTQKTERETKRLADAVRELHSDKDVHALRKDGIVTVSWRPIAKVQVHPGDEPTKLLWLYASVSELGIDRQGIIDKFSSSARRPADDQWAV